jgi:NADH-quinone oxidoreductase subunit B
VFNNYALVPADKFLPISVHVPGCPPRPEALAHGILRLRSQVLGNPPAGWRERYDAEGTEEVLVGAGGTDPGSPDISVFHPGDTAGA